MNRFWYCLVLQGAFLWAGCGVAEKNAATTSSAGAYRLAGESAQRLMPETDGAKENGPRLWLGHSAQQVSNFSPPEGFAKEVAPDSAAASGAVHPAGKEGRLRELLSQSPDLPRVSAWKAQADQPMAPMDGRGQMDVKVADK